MIEMKVMGIALDTRTGSPIVVLHDKENRKALPIWIGSAEASAIIRKIENLNVARPMTHDLIISIIEKTGYKLEKVEINDVEKDTYYATLFLVNTDGNVLEIDSRPSDAIAVAIKGVSALQMADMYKGIDPFSIRSLILSIRAKIFDRMVVCACVMPYSFPFLSGKFGKNKLRRIRVIKAENLIKNSPSFAVKTYFPARNLQ